MEAIVGLLRVRLTQQLAKRLFHRTGKAHVAHMALRNLASHVLACGTELNSSSDTMPL